MGEGAGISSRGGPSRIVSDGERRRLHIQSDNEEGSDPQGLTSPLKVVIRALDRDGRWGVFFGAHQIAAIDLTDPKPVGHVSEQVSAMSPG